jgi:uroporphyrinogen decarboxylase
MTKREHVLSLLDAGQPSAYIPAAFFLHFDPIFHVGQGAVDKHLEYFNATGMDLIKIQYERTFPHVAEIRHPIDWVKMPFHGLDFYQGQLDVVEGLVKAAKKDAVVILTLYSPFMCAGHATSADLLAHHMLENPDAVNRGMEIITDSLMLFVKEAIRRGVDGFYTSTQGGEDRRFAENGLFDRCVRPYDLALMEEINRQTQFNILHVCDYSLPYRDLTPFVNYPGQVVSCGLDLAGGVTTAKEVAKLYGRPFMGGLERKGIIAHGTPEQIRAVAEEACQLAPERFILGADCTVPGDTPWTNLKLAIDVAHHYRS